MEKICKLNTVLGYRSNLYFHDYKLAVAVDEKGHKDRNIDHEIKRQKALEKELDFNIYKVKNEIFRRIKELIRKKTKKSSKKILNR